MFGVADCVRDRVRPVIPEATEWQHVADKINATMILARADFVFNVRLCLALHSVPLADIRAAITQGR
jgi:hypothetical protein